MNNPWSEKEMERIAEAWGAECGENLKKITDEAPEGSDRTMLLDQAIDATYKDQFRGNPAAISKLRFGINPGMQGR
jgi:hypothetical protein